MTRRVALLRGINVGGHNRIAMADLRGMFTDLGFTDVSTLLQSGNVVFSRGRPSGVSLERHLERETAERLGVGCAYVVRTAAEWHDVIARNPFGAEAERDPSKLLVTFCKEAPSDLDLSKRTDELVEVDGREIFAFHPRGLGRSKLDLTAHGTARNWNTVLRIADVLVTS